MAVISRASVQNLKNRVDIVEVVSAVVALKRAGSKFKGLSPFNPEKTPSFFVSPDKGLFKCFSSGKAGDVITFVMETERLGFTEAVETLARRFNVPLEYEKGGSSREERSLRQELFELHEMAAQCFRDAFLAGTGEGSQVREYWTARRRFGLEVAEDFTIGLAESTGGRLLEHLRRRGFGEEALRQCGLFYLRGTTPGAPRFRGRLMIPIRDHQGRIVAFTARQLDLTPADDPTREAKYVNSPDTPIFNKSQILFNLDRARRAAGPDRPFLMVEGQLDAIRCWSAGLTTAIAPQGTAVTENQLRLLRRYHAGVECLLDGDAAGQRAALRLLPLALREGLEISFLPLSGKTDPDELVRDGGATAIDELRASRLGAMAFAASAVAPAQADLTPRQRAEACRELFAIIAEADSEVAQAEYLGEVATRLRLSRSAVEADYRNFRSQAAQRRAAASAAAPSALEAGGIGPSTEAGPAPAPASLPDGLHTAEYDLLLLVLHFEALGKSLAAVVQHEWIDLGTRAGRLLDLFLNDFAHDVWPGADRVEEHLEDPDDRNFLASLRFDPPELEDPVKIANQAIRRIVSNFCGPKISRIELEIAAKQPNFDADLVLLQKTRDEYFRLRLNPPSIRPPD